MRSREIGRRNRTGAGGIGRGLALGFGVEIGGAALYPMPLVVRIAFERGDGEMNLMPPFFPPCLGPRVISQPHAINRAGEPRGLAKTELGEQRFNLREQFGEVALNHAPDGRVIDGIVAVDDAVSKSHHPRQAVDTGGDFRCQSSQSAQGFTDDLGSSRTRKPNGVSASRTGSRKPNGVSNGLSGELKFWVF